MDDIFASAAAKYAILFQLNPGSEVLLVGPWHSEAVADFRRQFPRVNHLARAGDVEGLSAHGKKYDLVWWEEGETAEEETLPRLGALVALMRPSGTLVVTTMNTLSVARIKAYLKLRLPSTRPALLAPWRRVFQLRRAGLNALRTFLAYPYTGAPLELIAASADAADLAHNEGAPGRLLARLGLYAYAHPRYAIIGGGRKEALPMLAEQIAALLRSVGGAGAHIEIERAMLRARGALVLSIKDRASRRRYICRIAPTKTIDRVVARNMRVLKRIHDLPGLRADHKEKVPLPVAAGNRGQQGIYLETARPGMLAWRVAAARPACNPTILNEALAFILGFHVATRVTAVVTPRRYQALLGDGLARLGEALAGFGEDSRTVIAIDARFRRHLLGRRTIFVWGHGDYGQGNLLCAPGTGRLQGVIDWDTFQPIDLPAVDYLNLLLQRQRLAHGGAVAPALGDLWRDMKRGGPLTAALTDCYRSAFSLPTATLCLYSCLAALRIVIRAIPYTSEFQATLADSTRLLATIKDLLDTDPATADSARNSPVAARL